MCCKVKGVGSLWGKLRGNVVLLETREVARDRIYVAGKPCMLGICCCIIAPICSILKHIKINVIFCTDSSTVFLDGSGSVSEL